MNPTLPPRMIRWACRGLATLTLTALSGWATAQTASPLSIPTGPILLEVHGAISQTNAPQSARFDWAMLQSLPQTQLQTKTVVTDGVHTFDGVLVRDLLDRVQATGDTVVATALNHYIVDIPVEEFDRYDIILAYAMDGKRLHPSDKGPLWIVYPRDDHPELQDIRYDYKWVWQLIRLDIQ